MKTKSRIWRVGIRRHPSWVRVGRKSELRYTGGVVVVTDDQQMTLSWPQRIRSISPHAAGRQYLRGRLPVVTWLCDDGGNVPGELFEPTRYGRRLLRNAKRLATDYAIRVIRATSP